MKKTTSTLIIVLILIILAPLIGYFGTKAILLSRTDAPEEAVVQEQENITPQETPQENPEDENVSIEDDTQSSELIQLPEISFSAVQLASLSSENSAEQFIVDAKIPAISFRKDNAFKVFNIMVIGSDHLDSILEEARETYADAFISTGTVSAKNLKVEGYTQVLQETFDTFLSIFSRFDELAEKVVTGEDTDTLASEIVSDLDRLIQNGSFEGTFGADMRDLAETSKLVAKQEYSDFNAFTIDYLILVQKFLNIY
jgi:hypothetical protein